MKIKVTITEISHDDLVELISIAFTYSSFFVTKYDSIEYKQLPNADENNDCPKYKMAKLLLAGKSIKFCDKYAEDSSDFHGKLPHKYDSYYGTMDYTVTLKDIKKGLQKALNKGGYSAECAVNLINADGGNLDQPQAEELVQYIMFGESIYESIYG